MATKEPADKLSQLEKDVSAARAELAATVDELTAWFTPKTRLAAVTECGRRLVHDATTRDADPADRKRALIVFGAAGAALATVVTVAVVRAAKH